MEDYRLTQSGQEVQDIMNGAAMQVDLTAETERATDAEQTLQGNIDAEETRAEGAEGTLQDNIDAEEARAKAAEKQNADDIDAIEEKIPSGASSSNKLATEEYVNDSVATATATFRGTYNVVTDLNLLPSATHSQISASLQTEIATADSNDYAFVLIPTSVETPEEIEKIERYKYNGSVWGFEYVLNNSGFTAVQWAAINSGITSNAVGKLDALPNNAELTILLNGKQDTLTFDNVPTQGSSNPVKSGGVYSAIKSEETRAMAAESQVSSAIEAILLLIPSAASALNQLADKAFVNSSIATATATFRGTYNLVTDLSLNVNATHSQIAGALGINISTADNNDYAFVQIPTSIETPTEIRVTERYKFNGTEWAFEYDLNNSGFTSAQWAAINSGITIALVGKLNGLPTNAELTTLLNGKQDTLTFDNVPTQGSTNPVKSSGIYNVIKAITDLIPAEATAQNQLADKADVAAKIVAAIPSWKGQYDALTELQAVTGAKAGDMGCVKTTDSDGHAVMTFYQYSAQGAWVVYYTLRHYAQNKPATTGTTGDYPYNGMGRIELQKNIVNSVNTLTQAMLTQQNTIYVIQYDFTLASDVTIPANCVLEFEGGSISGAYTITGANTGIIASLVKIFNTDVSIDGTWNVAEAYPEWFGNDIASLNRVLDINSTKVYTIRLNGQLSAATPILVKKPVQIISNDFTFTQTKWGYPGIVIAADNVSIIGKISVISQVATRTQPTQSDSYWPDMVDAKASSSGICLGNLYNDPHAYQNIYIQHACCYNFIGGICNHGGTGIHNLIIDYLYVENVDFGLLGAGYFDTTINTIEFKDIASYVDSQDPSHAVYLTGGDTVGLSKNVIINRVVGTGLKSKGTDTVLSIKSTQNFRLLSANVSNIYGFCDAVKSNGIIENVFVDESYGYLVGSQLESDFVIKRMKATNVVGVINLIWNSGYGNISIEDSIFDITSEVAGGDNCLCYCSDGSLSLKNVDFNTIEGSVFALVGTRGSANVYIYDIKASIQIQKTLSGDPNVKTFLNPDKLNPANACGDSLLRLFNVILPNKTIYTDEYSNIISAGVCDKILTTSTEVRRIYAAYGNIITLINNGSTAIQANNYIQTKTGSSIPASDWKSIQFLGDRANHVTQIG